MTRIDKILIYTIISTALIATIMFVIFVSPRPPAIRNQMQAIHLLSRAHPEFVEEGNIRIERVVLGNGLVLWPEHEQAAAGYIFKAHVESSGFTVEAQPMKFGGTGVFSYFRDSTGVLRFEMDGKRATAQSRPLQSPVASKQP